MIETPKLEVLRLTPESMRELVRDRLSCQIMFSDEVPPNLLGMVFMPFLLGALNPPTEVLEKVLGSSEPPEALPEEPPKPIHPGYHDQAGEPPTKPLLGRIPKKAQSDLEWGYLTDEDWQAIKVKVDAANQEKIREWENATMAWMEALDQDTKARRLVDEEHAQAVQDWQESLSKHAEVCSQREKLRKEWDEKYEALTREWARDVGVLVGDMKHSFPRSINGFPMFHTMQIVHREDWERIRAAVLREQEKAKDFEI